MLNFTNGYHEMIAPLSQRLTRLFWWVDSQWGENRQEIEATATKNAHFAASQRLASRQYMDADTTATLALARSHMTNLSK